MSANVSLTEVVSGLAVLIAAVGGLWKVITGSRMAQKMSDVESKKVQAEQDKFITDLYQQVMTDLESRFEKDLQRREEEMELLRGRLRRAEDKIEKMKRDARQLRNNDLKYIEYLLGLLATHAPEVKVLPMTTDIGD